MGTSFTKNKLIRAGLHEEVTFSKIIRALLMVGNVGYAILKMLNLLVQMMCYCMIWTAFMVLSPLHCYLTRCLWC